MSAGISKAGLLIRASFQSHGSARVTLRRFYPSSETQLASRAYQSTFRVTYITIASTIKSAIAPMSSA